MWIERISQPKITSEKKRTLRESYSKKKSINLKKMVNKSYNPQSGSSSSELIHRRYEELKKIEKIL